MNHPATFVLPLSASRVLDVLHSMFAVGELIAISQDEIARVGNLSEASVSRAMPVLVEHGFIERSPFDRAMNGGRGGYWLRLLPLPAREGSLADPSVQGSRVDPLADERELCAPMPRTAFTASPSSTDQSLIPSAPVMVHDDRRIQEEELAHAPLFERLIAERRMDRRLAQRIARQPRGDLADFETDLKIAQTFARDPFFFTVAKWRDGQRVAAPEEHAHAHAARSATASGARRGSQKNRPAPAVDTPTDADYAALLAEIRAARPLTAEELGLPVPGQRRAADGR